MKDSEKLRIIQNNLSDGLHVPFRPIDEEYAISDLKIKLNAFNYALEGLKEMSSHSVIKHEDMLNLTIYWMNISINLEQVLSLVEYVDAALDPRDDIIEFEDLHHWEFSITRVKTAIEEYRKQKREANNETKN